MKTYIIPVLLAVLAAPAVNAADFEVCEIYAESAESIMTSRQYGAPMIEVMRIAQGNEVLVLLVKGAYKEPRWSTEANKQKAIREFANELTRRCLEVE